MYNQKKVFNSRESLKKSLSAFTIFLLFAATFYQAFFCFINTNIFTIRPIFLVLTEASLLLIVATYFILGPTSLRMTSLALFIVANTLVLALFQQHFDPKIIRNLIIPIMMIWVGTQYDNRTPVDRLLKILVSLVISVGILEFIFPDLYQKLFNVINYHIAIGRATEEALQYVEGGFSLNGTRWGGRNLLPILGDHRSSSLFLETVNMGNFGVMIACWGLSRSNAKSRLVFLFAACMITILADSRFASILIVGLVLLRFVPLHILKVISFSSPLLIIMLCLYYSGPMVEDNFQGRLGSTGYFLSNFTISEFLGLSSKHYSLYVDQGYAFLIHFSGIFLALILWISFSSLKMASTEGVYFKCLVAILIAANLAISGDSIFAFKWVALMWFLLGTEIQKTPQESLINDKRKARSAIG